MSPGARREGAWGSSRGRRLTRRGVGSIQLWRGRWARDSPAPRIHSSLAAEAEPPSEVKTRNDALLAIDYMHIRNTDTLTVTPTRSAPSAANKVPRDPLLSVYPSVIPRVRIKRQWYRRNVL